ncbi:nucleoporin Nup186/Nup192/Nup205 [Scheffersomyces xylosifermentans]|uniref:nucleoporin Nup186/Nup192/Nup205 n=1 Tax=Scheffersomyces xylosifermentans TaxID=1304137 RepID=UPI00315C9359
MASQDAALNWSTLVLANCYNAIKFEDINASQLEELIGSIKNDLVQILVTPVKNEASRNKLVDESKPVKFSDGNEYRLNKPFIEIAVLLSTELDLDEIAAAELIFNANNLSFQKGTNLSDSARLAYYSRFSYILNILGYLVSNKKLHLIVATNNNDHSTFYSNIIKSFEKIYKLLDNLNDFIDKQRVTSDINNLEFISSINYAKSQLFGDHELLAQVYFGLIDNYADIFSNSKHFIQIVDLIKNNISDEDSFILHFLPGLLNLVTKTLNGPDDAVDALHKHITTTITNDYKNVSNGDMIDLAKAKIKGFETIVYFVFLTQFIPWCKTVEQRTNKYDFKDDILKYLEWLINYGVMEILLSYSADAANPRTQELFEWSNLYDFRALLQKNFPRLSPVKFTYPSAQEVVYASNMKSGFENTGILFDLAPYKVSSTFSESLLAPFFHSFFVTFVNNAALVLTSLRDTEEDFVLSSINKKQIENGNDIDILDGRSKSGGNEDNDNNGSLSKTGKDKSGEGLDLDEIASRSDLERFYLAFAYTYNSRPELCTDFWSNDEVTSDIVGFISWGLNNNTSPLIAATFCLLLGSLASSGDDSSAKIWEILVKSNNSSLKKNDYSKISIDSIVDSLNYYIDALNENFEQDLNDQLKQQQKKQEFLFSSNPNKVDSDEQGNNKIIIELAEDAVVFISGFVQLISSIVRNLSSTNDRSREIKNIAFARFSPIITGFLKFDNLITGGKLVTVDIQQVGSNAPKIIDLPHVFVNDENRVVLTNLMLNFLSDFVHNEENLTTSYKVWRILDRWIFQGLLEEQEGASSTSSQQEVSLLLRQQQSRPKYASKRNVRISQAFQITLSHLSQVSNFVRLLARLLRPLNNEKQAFTSYSLLYPVDLGYGYRSSNSVGIWPYIEYLLLEIFSKTNNLDRFDDRRSLQSSIVNIVRSSLEEIDWNFLNDVAPQVITNLTSVDDIFDSLIPGIKLDYQLFVKSHHSIAILNYLFDEKAWKALFGIINIGVDATNANPELSYLVETALGTVDKVLDLQDVFINRLLPLLKNKDTASNTGNTGHIGYGTSMSIALSTPRTIFDNIYYPKSIGTHGTSDFYEVFLFNLTTVAHFGLYVGSSNTALAASALSILDQIRSSSHFVAKNKFNTNDPILSKNRLLTTFESIDESLKIIFAFIDRFESYDQELEIKYKILEFLLANLNQSNGREPTVAHFLLGYEIRGGHLHFNESIESNTLLKTLLRSLSLSLDLISEIDYNNGNSHIIDIGPAKLSSLILEILIKLSHDSISSIITLNHLREYDNLFEKLINYQPKLDLNTIWCGHTFDGNLQDGFSNEFIDSQLSTQAFFSFINQRNLILQYLSLEFHNIHSITKKEYYTKLLLNNKEFLNGTPKVLTFLDILNYNFKNFELHKYDNFSKKYNLPLILEKVHDSKTHNVDLSILSKVYKLVCQSSNFPTKESKMLFANEIMIEGNKISEFVTKYLVSNDLRVVQLKCLHSWCQLVEILITDDTVNSKNFILDVLQVILPKINDYLESDILFSEELISLSVLLFDLYDQEVLIATNKEDFTLGIQRLIPLFKTCIAGILNSNSTPNLRSDLYVLANKFLIKVINNEELVRELSVIIKSVDKKFIDLISNDAIYSEGSSRITSILLLESLIHLASLTKANFILELLVKNNSLLLLIRSVTRTDEMLQICSKSTSGIGLDSLLYELTAFRSTLYLLVRVAQSKAGALQLIQGEIFSILKQSNFLKIDPDLGLDLQFDEFQDLKNVKVNLLLDTPLSLNDLVEVKNITNENKISYFEFLIPIFQLVATLLLSMGPSYKPSIIQSKDLMTAVNRLVVGIMKRDMLLENKKIDTAQYKEEQFAIQGLKEMVKLFTLLDSLVSYEEKE